MQPSCDITGQCIAVFKSVQCSCCDQDEDLGDLEDEEQAAKARGAADISAFGGVLDAFLEEHRVSVFSWPHGRQLHACIYVHSKGAISLCREVWLSYCPFRVIFLICTPVHACRPIRQQGRNTVKVKESRRWASTHSIYVLPVPLHSLSARACM